MRAIRRKQRGTELYDLIKIQESYFFFVGTIGSTAQGSDKKKTLYL